MTTIGDVIKKIGMWQRMQISTDSLITVLEQFAAAQVAAETARCEKIAEAEMMNLAMLTSYPPKSSAAWNIRAAIRARGNP